MPEYTRVRIHYFLLFASMACVFPFITLFFEYRGLDSSETGVALALMPLVSLFAFPFFGMLTDRFHIHRETVIALALLAAVVAPLMLLPHNLAGFVPVVALLTLTSSTLIPLSDSIAFGAISRNGRAHYGSLRVWGTFGFIVNSIGAGGVLRWFGFEGLFYYLCAFYLLTAATAWRLPRTSREHEPLNWSHAQPLLKSANVIVFLLIGLVVQGFFSSGSFFISPLLREMGVGYLGIGVAWGVAVISEVPLMIYSGSLIQKWGVKVLIAVGMVTAGIRWGVIAISGEPAVLIAIQILHGFTFCALYVGAVTFMERVSPPSARAVGQTLYGTVSASGGRIVGFVVGGFLQEAFGRPFFYGVSATLTFAALACFLVLVREPVTGGDQVAVELGTPAD